MYHSVCCAKFLALSSQFLFLVKFICSPSIQSSSDSAWEVIISQFCGFFVGNEERISNWNQTSLEFTQKLWFILTKYRRYHRYMTILKRWSIKMVEIISMVKCHHSCKAYNWIRIVYFLYLWISNHTTEFVFLKVEKCFSIEIHHTVLLSLTGLSVQ